VKAKQVFLSTLISSFVLTLCSFAAQPPLPPSPPSYGVRTEQAWIPMKDGIRLAVTLYMPDGAKPGEKFPVLLEYLPYRKDDGTAARDYPIHSWFAHRGFVSVRVDIRGTGASEGRPPDREYSEQEQLDGEQVIARLAAQPWSNGSVGMFGISWGGFNSIQMAMRRPPALKAILAVDATEELFHDDIHYIDGMMHIDEFELGMDLDVAITPAPDYTLDESVLGPRFDTVPWSLLYLKHQRDGEFWHSPVRSLREIKVPCFVIGGWLDGYRDSIPRMLSEVKGPIRAMVGPWNHTFPHDAIPGPQIEWRDEAVRWFDYWLKRRDTGAFFDPRLVVYMRRAHPPGSDLKDVPGYWRLEDNWPPREMKPTTLYLHPSHALGITLAQTETQQLKYVPSKGVEAGFWWGELLPDQSALDSSSLVYDTAPLTQDLAMLGRPQALLQASASAPLANWFVRLSDIAPNGKITQVTGAGLNGAQRDSMSDRKPLEPGRMYGLNVEMHFTSWIFPKGHRIRLAVSNALWPMIWPTPYPMTTSLQLGGKSGSRLILPLVSIAPPAVPPAFSPPQHSEERKDIHSVGYTWPGEWKTERDEATQKTTVTWSGEMTTEYPWGKEIDHEQLTYAVGDLSPDKSSVLGEIERRFELKDRVLSWRGHLSVTSDATTFFYKYTRELLKDGNLVKTKTWEEAIPRDNQ
jgi:uncharacterized protein